MNTAIDHRATTPFLMLAAALLLASCSADDINDTGLRTSVCHMNGPTGAIIEVKLADLPEHKSHGDYVTLLEVDKLGSSGDSVHFNRITDALEAARAGRLARNELDQAACRITISVTPGTFTGKLTTDVNNSIEQFPLTIDVPDITLRGAMEMELDALGRATGVARGGAVTTLSPTAALTGGGTGGNSQNIIVVNGRVSGSKGHGAIVEGFVFQSGRPASDTLTGGIAILGLRAQGIVIQNSRFEGGVASAVDLRASSGTVQRIFFSGRGSSCDICLAGPGNYIARDNRLIGGGIPGILILPAVVLSVPVTIEQYTLPATATVTALAENNEVRGHVRRPVGVGLRVGAVGIGAQTVAGTSKVTFRGNNLVDNTFGIIIEAAFLSATDPTRRRGDIELVTSGSTISGSCQNNVLVTMSGSQPGLGISSGPSLVSSKFTLDFGSDIIWDNVWFANAAGTGNTLIVNGQTIPNGGRHAYDAARTCP